ncbi:MAG: hypothetical protein LBJ44_00020 [Propionibacteriaceae bacterium]|jgi:hypothetical protein|nr:hypothetical protein [Propionibacteriaceae bacterium]
MSQAEQADWTEALAWALTGQPLDLGQLNDPDQLLAALEGRGWDATALRSRAQSARDRGQPWPDRPPAEQLARIGAARWRAATERVVACLGLQAVALPPSRRTSLTADERRLLAERPPHHGS